MSGPTAMILAIILSLFGGGAGMAAEPFKDFTFKTVRPPAPGATKRITIQITPKAAAPDSANSALTPARPGVQTMNAWFWSKISPDLDAKTPGRFAAAARLIATTDPANRPVTPPLERLHRIVADHGTDILVATLGTRISPALVLAMIGVEADRRADSTLKPAASGLMRLPPDISAEFEITDPADPAQNIKAGVAHFARLLARYDNDPILALAANQVGVRAIDQNNGVPPFAETRSYVPRVIATFQAARGLCITAPELYSDGCVFLPEDKK